MTFPQDPNQPQEPGDGGFPQAPSPPPPPPLPPYGQPAPPSPTPPSPGPPSPTPPSPTPPSPGPPQYQYYDPQPLPSFPPPSFGGAPPDDTQRSGGRFRALIVLPVLLLCFVISAVAIATYEPGPHFPEEWDPRVEPFIGTVERLRGLEFEHPVPVYFLTPEEYSNLTRSGSILHDGSDDEPTNDGAPSDEGQQSDDGEVETSRALGVLEGEPDLEEASEELADTGSLAHYDPTYGVVNVRGEELDVALQITLVHELTHALQDQHFDLSQIGTLTNADEYSAFRAVFEGDAVSIEREYLAEFSEEEQDQYYEAARASYEQAQDDLAEVPSVLQSIFSFYYVVGNPFIDTVGTANGVERDNDLIDEALRNPPGSSQQLLHYPSYAEGRELVEVDQPAIEENDELIEAGPNGAAFYFIMLSERMGAPLAMHAVDALAGDNVVSYRTSGGLVCVIGDVVAWDDNGADDIEAAFKYWTANMPEEANATTSRDDVSVRFKSCDPGKDADMGLTDQSAVAMSFPATRLDVMAGSLLFGQDPEFAWCYADALVSRLTPAQIQGDFTEEEQSQFIIEATEKCTP